MTLQEARAYIPAHITTTEQAQKYVSEMRDNWFWAHLSPQKAITFQHYVVVEYAAILLIDATHQQAKARMKADIRASRRRKP
jgi:hypothetical protein